MRMNRIGTTLAFLAGAFVLAVYGTPRPVVAAPDPVCYPKYVCGNIK